MGLTSSVVDYNDYDNSSTEDSVVTSAVTFSRVKWEAVRMDKILDEEFMNRIFGNGSCSIGGLSNITSSDGDAVVTQHKPTGQCNPLIVLFKK